MIWTSGLLRSKSTRRPRLCFLCLFVFFVLFFFFFSFFFFFNLSVRSSQRMWATSSTQVNQSAFSCDGLLKKAMSGLPCSQHNHHEPFSPSPLLCTVAIRTAHSLCLSHDGRMRAPGNPNRRGSGAKTHAVQYVGPFTIYLANGDLVRARVCSLKAKLHIAVASNLIPEPISHKANFSLDEDISRRLHVSLTGSLQSKMPTSNYR